MTISPRASLAVWSIMIAVLTPGNSAKAADSCIDVQRAGLQSFKGKLTYKIFNGSPYYGDVRKGDTPEPTYILQLQNKVCVKGDDSISAADRIDRIQIFPDSADNADPSLWWKLRSLIGQQVVVEGSSPFGASTGHHHAPLLLPITTVAPVDQSIRLSPAPQMPTVDLPEQDDPTSSYGTPITTVQGFYDALEVGSGDEAVKFVIPQKRSNGPLSAGAITAFYRDMAEPLQLIDVSVAGSNEYNVRYTYAKSAGHRCDGKARVRTTKIDGLNLIASITALNGC